MQSMPFSELKTFVASWPRGLVGLVFAGLLVSWLLGQITLGQICLVLLPVVSVLYWTSRQARATEKSASVAQEGHLTEGFDRAIEKLGADNLTIRLGGISALERIAKDSEKDHGRIMEVLTAYVREKAPRQYPSAVDELPTDIQAILTVIGRRKTTGNNRGNARLNLSKTQLADAILPNANLSQVDLIQANLRWANLKGADLEGADLEGAVLTDVDLTDAKNLTAEQVQSATNWRKATLPDYLQYLLTEQPGPPA